MAIFIFTSLDPYISTWFTPTFLFCFLNIMIATIYVASNFKSHHHQEHQRTQITRVPSLLQRVKSIDFSFQNYQHHDPFVYTQNPDPSQLQAAPSILERVKSFSLYKQEQHQPNSVQDNDTNSVQYPTLLEDLKSSPFNKQEPYHDSTRLVRYPSFLQRVMSFSLSEGEQHHPDPNPNPNPNQESEHEHSDQPKLVRYPTLLQRVKSIKAALYNSEQSDLDSDEVDHHVTRSKSEKAPARVVGKMKKSASVKNVGPSNPEEDEDVNRRRPETVRGRHRSDAPSFGEDEEVDAEDEEVDAKADDFINKFKQQLKLQRLDSLIRYKEMLNRK